MSSRNKIPKRKQKSDNKQKLAKELEELKDKPVIQIHLFPVSESEVGQKSDLQTLVYVLTQWAPNIASKCNRKVKAKAMTILINIMRNFFPTVKDKKLTKSLMKDNIYLPFKQQSENCQEWASQYVNLSENPFIESPYAMTLAVIALSFCAIQRLNENSMRGKLSRYLHKYHLKLEDLPAVPASDALNAIHEALWTSNGELLVHQVPNDFRDFILFQVYKTVKETSPQGIMAEFIFKELEYVEMVAFKLVKTHLMERCPEMMNWAPIVKETDKFLAAHKKFVSMGDLGPYAKIILSGKESALFQKENFERMLVVAVAIGMEENVRGIENYAPEDVAKHAKLLWNAQLKYRQCKAALVQSTSSE